MVGLPLFSPCIVLYPCVLCVLQLKRHIQYSSTLTNMEFSTPKYNFELSDCLISNLQAFNISFRKYLSKRVNKPNLIHLEKPVHKCLSVNQFKHVG